MARAFGADFRADQQARQIGRQAFRPQVAEQAFGAHREDQGQERLVGHGAIDAQLERRVVVDVVGHQVAEDRMRLQHLEHFTGHVGREAGDDAVLDRRPLAVRARQDENAVALFRRQAEDLGLLAAHDVEDARMIGGGRQAGNDLDLQLVRRSVDDAGDDALGIGGAGDVGGLAPTGARADHACQDDRQVGTIEFAFHHRLQRLLEAEHAEVLEADIGVVTGDDLAVGAVEKQTEVGRTPVGTEQGGWFGCHVNTFSRLCCSSSP